MSQLAKLLPCILLLNAAGVDASPELQLAQRYFSRRQGHLPSGTLRLLQGGALDPASLFDFLPPTDSRWQGKVSLARSPTPASRNQAVERHDIVLNYRVIQRIRGPIPYWRVRVESPVWGGGLGWEQEILGEDFRSRIRVCKGSECTEWRDFDSEGAVPTAGSEAGGSVGDQGLQALIFLPSRSLRAALPDGSGGLRWEGEDFFGRSLGWEWSKGNPWPARLWSAQGEVRS